jgi:Mrp family chromosome partitioning ATPase
MHQLVEDLGNSGEFDLILFDTPPVLGLADAALVAEHCDGLMLLVSLDRVDRSLPKEAVNRIRSSGAPLLGIVTNAIKQEQKGSSAYGYGQYGYGKYGYGYGYGGYGYAAYDTTSAYAHYADVDEADGNNNSGSPKASESDQNKPSKTGMLRDRLRARQIQFVRWIDS